jgi:hypothetical protein
MDQNPVITDVEQVLVDSRGHLVAMAFMVTVSFPTIVLRKLIMRNIQSSSRKRLVNIMDLLARVEQNGP